MIISHIELSQVLCSRPVLTIGLYVDLPLAAKSVEIIYERSTHEGLHLLIDITQLHAMSEYLIALDVHVDLRHGKQDDGEGTGYFRALSNRFQVSPGVADHKFNVP